MCSYQDHCSGCSPTVASESRTVQLINERIKAGFCWSGSPTCTHVAGDDNIDDDDAQKGRGRVSSGEPGTQVRVSEGTGNDVIYRPRRNRTEDFSRLQFHSIVTFICFSLATARNDLLVKKRGGSGSIEPASKTDVTPEYNSLIPLPLCCQMFEITENYLKEQYDITTVHNQIT